MNMTRGKTICSVIKIICLLVALPGCSDKATNVERAVDYRLPVDTVIVEKKPDTIMKQTAVPYIPLPLIPQEDSTKVFDVVEQMPRFPGGSGKLQEYIEQNMHYPAKAKAANLQGRVIIAFIVEKDGSISHVKVVKSVDPLLDEEALRIVKSMPKWHPGKQTYLPVRVKIFLPVTFQL